MLDFMMGDKAMKGLSQQDAKSLVKLRETVQQQRCVFECMN